ncbi:RHS repeat-associated core domain-containing protein [Pseudoalteromonas rubra]|uniref:RHS repeat-associated core domain-containing protein n=1 Tax=Pseudoalteromonas rubra TaxID=43658 RepID=UPI000F7B8772|nr:RHS repeat-associated core domain-containing protein [Pseudoalteromonas rubra]
MSYRAKSIRALLTSGAILTSLLSVNAVASSDRATSFTLKWNAVEGASHYLLEEKQSDGSWKGVHEQQTRELTSTINKSSHGKYTYRVSGCIEDSGKTVHCGEEVAEYSAPLTVDTKSGDPTQRVFEFATTNDANQVTLPNDDDGIATSVTPGEFRVDESGNATYQVPFEFPIGPGGIRPQLGLSYSSSNTRMGAAGIGWSLSGLSVVSRCAKSHFYNQISNAHVKDVQFNLNDAFCVDGQRLVKVSGNTFRTESDSFTEYKMITSGSDVTGFEATTKSGDVYYYGNLNNATTATQYVNSALTNNRDMANTWMLSSIEDIKSNTISFSYKSPGAGMSISEEALLDNISYGQASINFNYIDVTEPFYGYRFGNRYQRTKKLSSVVVNNSGYYLRSYALAYEPLVNIGSNDPRFLKSVQLCSGYGLYKCAQALNFSWNESIGHFNSTAKHTQRLGTREKVGATVTADLNGDGHGDLIYYTSVGRWNVEYGGNLGTDSITFSDGKDFSRGKALVSDFNGDGRADILVQHGTGKWHLIYQEGEVTSTKQCRQVREPMPNGEYLIYPDCYTKTQVGELLTYEAVATYTSNFQTADMNGDGLMDLVYRSGEKTKYRLNSIDSNGKVSFGTVVESTNLNDINTHLIDDITDQDGDPFLVVTSALWGDINGDGLTDILLEVEGGYERCYVLNQSGDEDCSDTVVGVEYHYAINKGGVFEVAQVDENLRINKLSHAEHARLVDLNGDGLQDILYAQGNKWRLQLSNGAGFEPEVIEVLSGRDIKEKDLLVMDYDADLEQEVLVYTDGYNPKWQVYEYNVAEGKFFPGATIAIERKNEQVVQDSMLFTDFNGDGLLDWVRVRYDESNVTADVFTHEHVGKKHRVITGFTDGMDNLTSVTYKPLTDDEVYEGTLESRFPIISARGPSYVVASATSPNGIGGTSSIEYRYANMAFHGQGKGYLGFGKLTTIDSRDPNYKMVTETFYHQGLDPDEAIKSTLKYPELVGMPIRTIQKMEPKDSGDAITLSDAKNIYAIKHTKSKVLGEDKRSPYFAYIDVSEETAYFLPGGTSGTEYSQGGIKSTTITTQVYDNSGNVTSSSVKLSDAIGNQFTTHTANYYAKAPSQCDTSDLVQAYDGDYTRFGRLTCSVVTKTNADGKSATRKSAFAYNADGMLYQEKANAQSPAQSVLTSYKFDSFGNKTQTTVTGAQLEKGASYASYPSLVDGKLTRTSTVVYEPTGRYIKSQTNALGHTVCFDVDLSTGLVKKQTSNVLNCSQTQSGLVTTYTHNAMGQLTGEESPSGIVKRITRNWITNGYYLVNGFSETVEVSGGQPVTQYYDKQGRVIKQIAQSYGNQQSVTKTEYDAFGRAHRTSIAMSSDREPGSTEWQTSQFDILNRVIQTRAPSFDGAMLTVNTRFNGFNVTETHSDGANNITKRKTYNVAGELVQITDNSTGVKNATASTIKYQYDAYGQLLNTTDSKNNRVVIEYDTLGNKKKTSDPDKGTWEYRYNALGELKWQKDANGTVTWQNYDGLGRVKQRIDSAQSAAVAQSRCYDYDHGAKLGTVSAKWVTEGFECSGSAPLHQQVYTYDDQLRVTNLQTSINENGQSFVQQQSTAYDNLGRVYLNQLSNNYAVGIQYDAQGFKLAEIGLRYDSATDQVERTELMRVSSVNFRGQVTEASYLGGQTQTIGYDSYTGLASGMSASGMNNPLSAGSGFSANYQYNAFGQLAQRSVSGLYQQNRTEKFEYDGLNRLKQSETLYGSGRAFAHYCYDALGNMTTKGSSSSCSTTSNVHFEYGNAARSTGNGGVHALVKDKRTGKAFNYDNNGNMVNDGSRSLIYSGFDKVTSIRQADNMQVEFRYGTGLSRYYRKDVYLGTQDVSAGKEDSETYYLGAFERINKTSGLVYQYTVGNMQVTENMATGEVSHKLMLRDHLGSVLAISEVNDAQTSAQITQAFRYDPFGQQYVLQANKFDVFTGYMRQGFTGHEMLNDLNIIHMNGRIYDPTLGRFLQADPHIQAPGNSQSYNRYSYVLNNPLSYTDPSGYFFKKLWKKVKKFAGVIAGAALVYFTGGTASWFVSSWYGAATAGAIAGAVGAAANGGNILSGALKGALSAAAFYGVGSAFSGVDTSFGSMGYFGKVAAHGVTGGIMSVLHGGKFGHGFAAAGVTQAFASAVDGIQPHMDRSALRVVAAAIIGGTASKISGGKFSNGAVTGAFSRAFNDEMVHESLDKLSENQKTKLFELKKRIEVAYSEKDGLIISGKGSGVTMTFGENSRTVSTGSAMFGQKLESDITILAKEIGLLKLSMRLDPSNQKIIWQASAKVSVFGIWSSEVPIASTDIVQLLSDSKVGILRKYGSGELTRKRTCRALEASGVSC